MDVLRSRFGSNKKLALEGKWITIESDDPTKLSPRFKIARASAAANPRYAAAMERLGRPHRHKFKTGMLSSAKLAEIQKEAFLETVLLDWENVHDLNTGDPLPYSKEAGKIVMDEFPDLYEYLSELADSIETFREEEEELGNLKSGLGGNVKTKDPQSK